MKKLKITEKTAKIKLSRNPYLNARVRVMKSKLIVPEDYPKLLKMTPSEVSHFLGDGEYKAQIDELAVKHDGADLIELALNANASKSYGKVMRISKGTTREVITKYLLRLDIANLKTVLRGFYSGTSEEEISQAIIPGCRISVDALLFLLKKESMDDILSDSSVLRVFPHLKSYTAPKDGITLAYIENLLDSNYYTELFAIAEALPKNAS
ncbi:MAG: V-type ATPase subunit, partial [Candidatus Aenigmarchaeota archaeon]|nr:V-type ATPase subunit [Candidatus Aenigmarchaeota archaeon]